MSLKKSDLYSSLWASCDELRGGMDASQYKDYVLVMLFIKYISDKYAGDPYAPIIVPKGSSFKDMISLKGKASIGDDINKKIIAPIADKNKSIGSIKVDFDDSEKLGSGPDKVKKLTNLIAIFENPDLDFSKNKAEGDDILGDAYEYLMRHFATESGKSKGQFYTPAEVSRIIAKIIGINAAKTTAETTVYDPTCGSGSLLLKVGAESGKNVTLYGQEMDVATAGLARMNMVLHGNAHADIQRENTLANPLFKDQQGRLKTFDFVVANPPFSFKSWSNGVNPTNDPFERFKIGDSTLVPPAKNGDYAFLLHILKSLNSKGKGAVILPHGVLFRGNAEAEIRKTLIKYGYIKGIIGLPANLFYGTGIPACILVLDKEDAHTRKGIFMIDASKGFMKDGNKNRLREQDIHKIVDVFTNKIEENRYSRIVPVSEISDAKNDYNLNLPRYIDSTGPEDLQDIDAHLRGGIPDRDIDALDRYWKILPSVRAALFKKADRAGYSQLKVAAGEIKAAIFNHTEFAVFSETAMKLFLKWKNNNLSKLKSISNKTKPKLLAAEIAEDLLAVFEKAPLLDAYDVYQHLMDYWGVTMQDDCYLIVDNGWKSSVLPREIKQIKNKEGKLVWPEEHDYMKGKSRLKSDLLPSSVIVKRYFKDEQSKIEDIETEIAGLEQQLDEMREENSDEEGLLAEVIEGEGEKQKITDKAIKARLKQIDGDAAYDDERAVLESYAVLLNKQKEAKSCLKAAQEDMNNKIHAKYSKLTKDEIKALVVEDKWLDTLAAAVHGEMDRVSQTLTGRIRQLAERYATPLPQLANEVAALAARVEGHLKKMGVVWK